MDKFLKVFLKLFAIPLCNVYVMRSDLDSLFDYIATFCIGFFMMWVFDQIFNKLYKRIRDKRIQNKHMPEE